MTYRAGFGDSMAKLGFQPGPPRVLCDGAGCAVTVVAQTRTGGPPSWLLNRRAPPKWKRIERIDDGRVLHFCPGCVTEGVQEPKP